MSIELIKSIIDKYICKYEYDLEDSLEKKNNLELDFIDNKLFFNNFFGQEETIDILKVAISSSYNRNDTLDHILLSGPPGYGKSLLAKIIANEATCKLKSFVGTELKDAKTFLELKDYLLVNSKVNKILFIDEIHNVPIKNAEILYGAIQDYVIGNSSIGKFTLIGATTNPGKIPGPLKDRFCYNLVLKPYSVDSLIKLLIINFGVNEDVAKFIATRSKGIPRLAIHYCKMVVNTAASEKEEPSMRHVIFLSTLLGLMDNGLTRDDVNVLKLLANNSSPIGEKHICSILGINKVDYEILIEPFLLKEGLLSILPNGRSITLSGRNYLVDNNLI